ncbi:hypothetical protein [Micromonospora sp. NPDC023956]|uniref:hypothetical protein n=1 Tax=Micromonospora sp. NPDC023956 TaxID=3155722 RepID=UPI0033D59838
MDTLTTALRQTGFADRVDRRRRRARSAYEPFPPDAGLPAAPDDAGDRLFRLLHDGTPAGDSLDPKLAKDLVVGDFADETLAPARWELTAYRGLLAARDRAGQPGGGTVYLGEDSLRFVATILDAAPHGRALDVGSGSGITGCALARTADHVLSVDLLDECRTATTLSATLNGLAHRVDAVRGRFQEVDLAGVRFNCLAANLPYVPTPPGFAYSPAGNGGPDGLDAIRDLLGRGVDLLDPDDGMLVMRFQCLGHEGGPLLLDDLRGFAARTGYDVVVVADGRVPYEVRAALTATLATGLNPDRSPAELLDLSLAHLRGYHRPSYLACGLVARSGGTGQVEFVDLSAPPVLDVPLTPTGPAAGLHAAREQVVAGYWYGSRDLPDGFWELADETHVEAPVARVAGLIEALADGVTVRDAAEQVFADLFAVDPLRARSLLVTTELLAHQLLAAGLLTT